MQLEGDQRLNEHLEANKWWIMSSIQLQPCCAHWRSPSQPQPKDLPSVLLVVFFKECLHWIFRWEKDKTALFNCSCWKNSFQFMNPSIQPFISLSRLLHVGLQGSQTTTSCERQDISSPASTSYCTVQRCFLCLLPPTWPYLPLRTPRLWPR